MAGYPKRPQFFAAKVCKLLGRTCAAQTITPAGAFLVTQIAYVEDAKRYSGPVTYFREPLMQITGIGTAARLIRVRDLCVEAGWLHYEEPPKGSRQPGVYWVTIPEQFGDLPLSPYDDEPVAQSNANQYANQYANRTRTDTRIEREPIRESNANQHTFIPSPGPSPSPSPIPSPEEASASAEACRAVAKTDGASPDRSEEIRQVFDHYRVHHPRSHPSPNSKTPEWGKIRARLTEGFSVKDLCDAIDGCHVTPHNCGENTRGQKYQALDLIVRNGSQVSRFIESLQTHGRDGPVLSERTAKTVRAGQNWLNRNREATAE